MIDSIHSSFVYMGHIASHILHIVINNRRNVSDACARAGKPA